MPKTLLQRLRPWIFAAISVCVMTDVAAAGSFTRACAARDLQLLIAIEEQETTASVPEDKLSEALVEMMHARIVCHQGNVLDALAIYDAVAESIRPLRSGRAHASGVQ